MEPTAARVALAYDDDAYVETLRGAPTRPDGPAGLMGRQVAGKTFLDAYLAHAAADTLNAVVRNRAAAESIAATVRDRASRGAGVRRLHLVDESELLNPIAPVDVLHAPAPPDARHAWARQSAGGHGFALCGVTHTLSTARTATMIGDLILAPFRPYDALICTSTAVVAMVREVAGSYADYLADRHGGTPALDVRLEQIPLGVDTDAFRPATPAERAERRAALGIGDGDVAVLFVGRLSHHAKAHPYPMYRGLSEAARESGRAIHLIVAGWAANQAIADAFVDGARRFAPGVRVVFVDGVAPGSRFAVWHAADVVTSLSDSIQETFGLVVIEAMACGLPMVASDWDGYRDLIRDGETGVLVPTAMVRGSTAETTSRLLLGSVNYDYFLAECGQATAVDVDAAASAYARLIADDGLRRRLGAAARDEALRRFSWPRIVRAYEALWSEQDAARRALRSRGGPAPGRPPFGPACYPDPERSFAGYPTRWLGDDSRLVATAGAGDRLAELLTTSLTNHVADRRCADAATLHRVLALATNPQAVPAIDAALAASGVGRRPGRATIGWLLKYGLLRPA